MASHTPEACALASWLENPGRSESAPRIPSATPMPATARQATRPRETHASEPTAATAKTRAWYRQRIATAKRTPAVQPLHARLCGCSEVAETCSKQNAAHSMKMQPASGPVVIVSEKV